ncbi:hypothetical protein ACP6PL_18060 [Dapis sp. BLCC M126]
MRSLFDSQYRHHTCMGAPIAQLRSQKLEVRTEEGRSWKEEGRRKKEERS